MTATPPEPYPFHVNRWPKAIVNPEDHDGGDALSLSWDLGLVSEGEKKKAIRAWCAKLPTLQGLKRLQLWSHVTQPLFDAACQVDGLETLQIKWSNVVKLDAIRNLGQLRQLSIGSSTRIVSVEPLAALSELRLLEIENFKLVSDFSPLVQLRKLEDLAVTGSMWSRQAITTLEPFVQMAWLKSLAIDTSQLTSLRPLAALSGLRKLGLGGRLPFEEYAWLSARLPNTECRWFAPCFELAGAGHGACARCNQDSMVMLTGRGKPVICKHCDAAMLSRHAEAFEAVRSSARRDP